eukprot:scaffold313189_cov38-Prasinocladus_malaysianus.AAC.1
MKANNKIIKAYNDTYIASKELQKFTKLHLFAAVYLSVEGLTWCLRRLQARPQSRLRGSRRRSEGGTGIGDQKETVSTAKSPRNQKFTLIDGCLRVVMRIVFRIWPARTKIIKQSNNILKIEQ